MDKNMTIYAKNLTEKQRKVLQQYENLCGFEPMLQDDFDAGKITFRHLWNENVSWLESVTAEVQHIDTRGTFGDEYDWVE